MLRILPPLIVGERDRRGVGILNKVGQGMARVIESSGAAPQSGAPACWGRPAAGCRGTSSIDQYDAGELRGMIDLGVAYKNGRHDRPLDGKTLAMISRSRRPAPASRSRWRCASSGGDDRDRRRRQPTRPRRDDTRHWPACCRAMSTRLVMRTNHAEKLADLARHATVPVINGLTDSSHPCQIMADVMTLQEKKGPVADTVVAWSGDGNNVSVSWVHAAVRFGFALRLACPEALPPPPSVLDWARREGGRVSLTHEPDEAVAGADCVVTDTWVSMGVEANVSRHNLLAPYRVDERLMAKAKPDAIFMHCLPAKRGEEVTAAVIDGPQSVVWDEAENRLHVQKGILAWCIG
jgi:ornithine carbamoyltransferase